MLQYLQLMQYDDVTQLKTHSGDCGRKTFNQVRLLSPLTVGRGFYHLSHFRVTCAVDTRNGLVRFVTFSYN